MYHSTFQIEYNGEIIELECVFEIEPYRHHGYAQLVDAYLNGEIFDINQLSDNQLDQLEEMAYEQMCRG